MPVRLASEVPASSATAARSNRRTMVLIGLIEQVTIDRKGWTKKAKEQMPHGNAEMFLIY